MANYVYPKMAEARKRARDLGLPEPTSSTNKTKKLQVVYNNRLIHFGQRGASDFLIHKDEERRQNYRKRARGSMKKDKKRAYLDPNQPAFYAYHILW